MTTHLAKKEAEEKEKIESFFFFRARTGKKKKKKKLRGEFDNDAEDESRRDNHFIAMGLSEIPQQRVRRAIGSEAARGGDRFDAASEEIRCKVHMGTPGSSLLEAMILTFKCRSTSQSRACSKTPGA
jgi:hypothetical protein